jgi:phosphoglycolate phosphatase
MLAWRPPRPFDAQMNIQNILFDLDGTLTDPAEGIIKCYEHSLSRLNVSVPPPEELAKFIGPPIRATFAAVLQSSDCSLIEEAVAIYRERFSTVGLFENSVYEGVPRMLTELQTAGHKLFVATSKPQVFAERILNHFSLDSYFIKVHGNELNGRLDDKADLVSELIAEHHLRRNETMMVGDRRHDIAAAKRNCITSLGVTYGYGSEEELTEAGADDVCHQPEEVVQLINRKSERREQCSAI